jgi:multidrug efflux pump subunit AcrA (membrane-fusion protein)
MKILKILGTILILGCIIALSVGCKSKTTTTVKTQNYTVQKGSLSEAVTGTGNLALSKTESLAFEMAGYVEAVLVTEGETVKAGQQLVKLDTTEWDTQLKSLEKALTTAQRNLATKQKSLTTAERAVTTKETAVTTAQRAVTTKEVAVQQAELDLKTAQYNLTQIADVKKAQDAVDVIQDTLDLAKAMLNGSIGSGTGDTSYWNTIKINAQTELTEAKADLKSILDGSNVTVTDDVALSVARYQLTLTKSQMAFEDAQTAVDTATSAVTDAQQAVEDAKSAVADAQADVDDAAATVADAQDALDEANALSPIITAPFDGFISKVNVAGGDEVQKGTVALVVADPNQFSAKILVTEEDIFSVKLSGNATVSISALSDESFPAQVIKISPTATVSSGVVNYSVTVNITSLTPITTTQSAATTLPAQSANRTMPSGTPPGFSGNVSAPATVQSTLPSSASSATASVALKDGLSATVSIISQQKTNVLVIPSKAITRISGNSTVQVVTTSGTETRVVQTGMTDGTNTEITSGLSEGEKVQIKTTSSSSSSSSTKTASTQQQIQSISGGGPSGGPPGGGF